MKRQTKDLKGVLTPVSVIIPALNEERYLPQLLRSLLAAAPRDVEIIVVDGQSHDRTLDVVEAFRREAPPHVTIRSLESTVRNVSFQRNLGASEARHEILLFLDADTAILAPEDLGDLLGRFRAGGYSAATCRFRPLERDPRATLYFDTLYLFHRAVRRWNPYALGACIVTTREVFQKCKGFDPSIRVNEDAHFCQAAARHGEFGVMPLAIGASVRRFAKYGYLRMGLQYFWIFLDRTVRGEVRDDRIKYEFGNYA